MLERGREAAANVDLTRRQLLGALGGGVTALGAGKAADNVLLGYGVVVGTNLVDQDLAALAADGFLTGPGMVGGSEYDLELDDGTLTVRAADGATRRLDPGTATVADADAAAAELGVEAGPLREVVADLGAVRRDEYTFAFSKPDAFFERIDRATARPYTVGLARGTASGTDPETVTAFAGVDPADPEAIVNGLVDAFRTHSNYDVERYAAGSVQFNVLLNAVDLRRHFREPVGFDALMTDGQTGMFCTEYVARSREALHAVAAPAQRHPVATAFVWDRRHRHAYTAIASVVREGADLVVPMTFVDYTHSTLYDDFGVRGLAGEGLNAYNRRHRATAVYWS